MRQYWEVKRQHPDCVVLFRMGDFYETFYEDAKLVSKVLEITLTKRGSGTRQAPLAGIPYHALEPYLTKLIRNGHKVAICEQLEDPKKAKGLVKRGVVRIVTPGTATESALLDAGKNNYVMALVKENSHYGLAFSDISTGEFVATEVKSEEELSNELSRYAPVECIIPESLKEEKGLQETLRNNGIFINTYSERSFWPDQAVSTLKGFFTVHTLDGFGLTYRQLAVSASGALIEYLEETQKASLKHIQKIRYYQQSTTMVLDASTQKNLELLSNIRDNTKRGTLLSVLDRTKTPMGSRLLRKWMLAPLVSKEAILKRQHAIAELAKNMLLKEELQDAIENTYDVERLAGRISIGRATPRDCLALKDSLGIIPHIKALLKDAKSGMLDAIASMPEHQDIITLIHTAIDENAPALLTDGNIIKKGYNKELDGLRDISHGGRQWISRLEAEERERTKIKSLKVGFNRVFGYYIEVTKPNLHLVPETYIRKQTQVNAERFITPALKEYEEKVLGSQEKSIALEQELFIDILAKIAEHIPTLQQSAASLSELDVLLSLADVALRNRYVQPEISDSCIISLEESRHPVVETLTDNFVPNDAYLDGDIRTMIITGPNMSGKSTFMRQAATIILMAQLGSFVPAKKAKLGIFDRIFTRVGAYDDLSMGQSTFMVEMTETANILNNATEKSFVILDEIGRGTSTFDGVSIAWAVAENLNKLGCKTLFATHYHVLNKLESSLPGIKNFNVAVDEKDDKITFLYRIVEGGTDESYGIHVAKLAGVPQNVIERAQQIQFQLESEDRMKEKIVVEKKPLVLKDAAPSKRKGMRFRKMRQLTLSDL